MRQGDHHTDMSRLTRCHAVEVVDFDPVFSDTSIHCAIRFDLCSVAELLAERTTDHVRETERIPRVNK